MTFSIQVREPTTGAADAHGNVTETLGAPVPFEVTAIAPSSSAEPFERGRTPVITGRTLFLPPGSTLPSRKAVFVIDGEEWAAVGEPGDYSRGPFGAALGATVAIERVEG